MSKRAAMMYIGARPPEVVGFPLPPPSCMTRMPRGCLAALLVPALVLLYAPLGAQQEPEQQEVRGLVTEDGTGAPIEGAMILLIDLDGRRVGGVLSASNGRFRVPVPDPGRYVLRVERTGYASMDTELLEVPVGTSVEQRIVSTVRIQLAGLDVRGGRRCDVRPAEGLATATVWEEVRKALASATWTSDRAMYRFQWMRFERKLDQTHLVDRARLRADLWATADRRGGRALARACNRTAPTGAVHLCEPAARPERGRRRLDLRGPPERNLDR